MDMFCGEYIPTYTDLMLYCSPFQSSYADEGSLIPTEQNISSLRPVFNKSDSWINNSAQTWDDNNNNSTKSDKESTSNTSEHYRQFHEFNGGSACMVEEKTNYTDNKVPSSSGGIVLSDHGRDANFHLHSFSDEMLYTVGENTKFNSSSLESTRERDYGREQNKGRKATNKARNRTLITPLVLEKRRSAANAREKRRMHRLVTVYNKLRDILRNAIPLPGKKRRISRFETIRMAQFHIQMLSHQLSKRDR